MKTSSVPPTSTALLAASSSLLVQSGYRFVGAGFPEWSRPSSRLFEDEYNVVGVSVFTTYAELLHSWADAQGSLVEVVSQRLGRDEMKTWDGYLVLLTAGIAPTADPNIEAIRSDIGFLRKLVATGEELIAASDVERVLRPLLPLPAEQGLASQGSSLDMLPALLTELGVHEASTKLLVRAFIDQEPLMEVLHRDRGSK